MLDVYTNLKTFLRLLIHWNNWRYSSQGYCTSCNSKTLFLFSTENKSKLTELISSWELSDSFKRALVERENYFCFRCSSNFRMRAHAETVLKLLGMTNSKELLNKLKANTDLKIYETAYYNIFRYHELKKLDNYIVSEYFDNAPFGTYVGQVRNENLECLTFSDCSFDVIINSDVLEHVSDLNKALAEIKRVLKPGGFHVFTVPVDLKLENTVVRAIIKDGKIKNLKKPVMHGDTVRSDGILAFRDFGRDIVDYMSREDFICREIKYSKNDQVVTSVYYMQKQC